MKEQKYKAVVFDLDGTLLDTVQDIGAGANTALHRSGFPEFSIEDYRRFVGHGMRVLFEQIVPKNTDKAVFEDAFSYFLSYYPEHCTDHTDYYPGIREVLKKLADAGLLLGVLSNKTETTSIKIIRHFFPEIPFAIVWGSNGVRPLKPSTEAGVELCRVLQVKPPEVFYVGDGDTDMEFAARMGFYPAAATWGYRSREQELAAGARVLMDAPGDILKQLNL
jgi:phosphoglycolate phosphatase